MFGPGSVILGEDFGPPYWECFSIEDNIYNMKILYYKATGRLCGIRLLLLNTNLISSEDVPNVE